AVSLLPALRDSQDLRRKFFPGIARLVSIDFAYPDKQTEARRRCARILDDDLRLRHRIDQLGEALRRIGNLRRVVNEREPAPVEGDEDRVGPRYRKIEPGRIDLMRREEARGLRILDKVRVEAEHHIGLG